MKLPLRTLRKVKAEYELALETGKCPMHLQFGVCRAISHYHKGKISKIYNEVKRINKTANYIAPPLVYGGVTLKEALEPRIDWLIKRIALREGGYRE